MNALTATLPALRLQFEEFASSWFGRLGEVAEAGEQAPLPTHTLVPLDTLAIETSPGQQVSCLDGCVLLQYQGRPRGDIILVRGESHACEPDARLAILAFVAATLRID
ncbi:hypothetical protein [Ramlibacter alkalitolerans]|uniref:Uncharacterized protein n=1 Tax=Ramlibacter alkalitolerans TaxID=2039631 RepID=A0ABS1JK57_9BURK|nr:hypothetical protein [Ramlibacter alkalitolerans]MBL0424306.1 hypothetical protein [Ramlibacter alkalitolerans]